jgi:hypothetical protein
MTVDPPAGHAANGRARKVRTAKLHGQGKRGELSGAAPAVRPLDAKHNNRMPNHEKIVVIAHATLDTVMQLPGAFNDPDHHSL